MIEIYEINGERAAAAAANFHITVSELERVFIMDEGGEIGIGVLALDRGVVVVRDVIVASEVENTLSDKPTMYFDLLARSLLNVVRDFDPIKVRVKPDPYFLRFGFRQSGEFMEIKNHDIDFSSGCASHKK